MMTIQHRQVRRICGWITTSCGADSPPSAPKWLSPNLAGTRKFVLPIQLIRYILCRSAVHQLLEWYAVYYVHTEPCVYSGRRSVQTAGGCFRLYRCKSATWTGTLATRWRSTSFRWTNFDTCSTAVDGGSPARLLMLLPVAAAAVMTSRHDASTFTQTRRWPGSSGWASQRRSWGWSWRTTFGTAADM